MNYTSKSGAILESCSRQCCLTDRFEELSSQSPYSNLSLNADMAIMPTPL